MSSIREETFNQIVLNDKLFFKDFSRYNKFRKIEINIFQDLIDTNYYTEVYSSKNTNWNYYTRVFKKYDSKYCYKYILKCPICNQNIFRIKDNELVVCKLNHKIKIQRAVPKFLTISKLNKL
jgi:hypothetical protein